MRRKSIGLHFILAQLPHTAKCRLAQTLGRSVEKPVRAKVAEYKKYAPSFAWTLQLRQLAKTKTWQVRRSLIRHVRLASTANAKPPQPSSYANSRRRSQVSISVGGRRFAPACCAAQSVRQRGRRCTGAPHRLPLAAKHFHNQVFAHPFAVNRPAQMQSKSNAGTKFARKVILGNIHALRPNHSLNRTFCGVSQLGFISFSPNCLTPQNAG